MFTYLRYFYAISFVLIVIGALAVGMVIRSMMADALELAVKRDNLSLAQSFINTTWNRYYPSGSFSSGISSMATFETQSQKFVQNLSTLRFIVYNGTGKRAFASESGSLTSNDGTVLTINLDNPGFKGQVASRIVDDVMHSHPKNGAQPVTVIQVFVPIMNPKYYPSSSLCQSGQNSGMPPAEVCQPAIGVIETVIDITEQWGLLDTIQMVSSASIVGIFLALITILMFTTHRAESIIAKQHEVNLELTAAAASAEAENRDKSQFLANISHELRTPLNAIIGFSEIIKKEALENLNPTHQEYIRDIHNSGTHLLSLINDILDFSKAEAGKLELEMVELDLNKLMINSMRLVIPRAEEAQVTLVEDMPSEHVVCVTDGKKLKQVMLNLLSNAVKFTPPGGEVRVTLWEQLIDKKVCIEVRDTGIGIAPKDIAKVMTPFGQVDSKLSRKYEGTGLGLPLSKKFVEILGGEFLIESEVNVGTKITIKLPSGTPDKAAALQPVKA